MLFKHFILFVFSPVHWSISFFIFNSRDINFCFEAVKRKRKGQRTKFWYIFFSCASPISTHWEGKGMGGEEKKGKEKGKGKGRREEKGREGKVSSAPCKLPKMEKLAESQKSLILPTVGHSVFCLDKEMSLKWWHNMQCLRCSNESPFSATKTC